MQVLRILLQRFRKVLNPIVVPLQLSLADTTVHKVVRVLGTPSLRSLVVLDGLVKLALHLKQPTLGPVRNRILRIQGNGMVGQIQGFGILARLKRRLNRLNGFSVLAHTIAAMAIHSLPYSTCVQSLNNGVPRVMCTAIGFGQSLRLYHPSR